MVHLKQSKDTLAGFLLSLKDMKVVLKYHFMCVLLGFSQNFQAIPIMNHQVS